MVTPVAHAMWVAGSLFLVLLGFIVLATRPGAWLNRVLGALLILRGTSDLFYELMRDAASPGEALLAHRIANWYDWGTLLLTLLFLHYVTPVRRFPRARVAVLAAAGALTALLVAVFAVAPDWFAQGVVDAPGAYRVVTPVLPQVFGVLTAVVQLGAVLLAARDVGAPDLSVLQRRRAALIGLAFGLLLGQAGLVTAMAPIASNAGPTFAVEGAGGVTLAARAVVYGLGYAAVAVTLPKLARAFDGRGRVAFLGAGVAALSVSVILTLNALALSLAGVRLILTEIDIAVFRVPFVVLSAACLGLAVVRYGLAGFGAATQRRVAGVALLAIPLSLALLPVGAMLALTGGDTIVLGAALLLALGAGTLSPAPLRAAAEAVSRHVLVDPGDPAVAAERARRYTAELERRRAAEGSVPDARDAALQAFRKDLGLRNADHAMLVAMLPDPSAAGTAPLLGRYRMERELGRGAFGTALLATDIATGQRVVLKRFHAAWMEQRALAEARALAAVRHPRVVPLVAMERVGAEVFLVLAYAEGGSAQHLLDREGPLPPARALALAGDVLEGLGALHAAGLAHGDVKLSNILLDADGRALLSDLGSAKAHARADADATLTNAGVLGSYTTLAPEVLRGGSRSPEADLYAVGAVLYQLLTGRHYVALDGKDPVAAAEAILHEPPRLPDARVPGWLEPALAKALAKEPAQRFASAHAMRAALAPPTPRPRARPQPMREA